jgi:hypothetical protein
MTTTAVQKKQDTGLAPVQVPSVVTVQDARKRWTAEQAQQKAGSLRSMQGVITDAGNSIMFQSAVAFYNLGEVSDLIGKERPYENQEQAVLALGFSSKSYGTALARLGRAAMRHGVKSGTKAWTHLASNVTDTRYAAVLGKEAVSNPEFRKVLDALMSEADKNGGRTLSAAKRETKQVASEKDNGGKGDEKDSTATVEIRTAGDIIAVLHSLEPVLHGLSDEEATKVHAYALKSFVGSDRERRETLKRTVKGEVKPTPATVAKRTEKKKQDSTKA